MENGLLVATRVGQHERWRGGGLGALGRGNATDGGGQVLQ